MSFRTIILTLIVCALCVSVARADVTVTTSERVGYAPPSAGTGLRASYWKRTIKNTREAEAYAKTHRAQATWTATRLLYPNAAPAAPSSPVSLARFLGANASHLRGRGAGNLFSLFRFAGYLKITEEMDEDTDAPGIQITFAVRSDDGARLTIGGETVVSRNGAHEFDFDAARVHFESPGLYPIEVIYYENFGVAGGLAVYSGIEGDTPAPDAPPGTVAVLPTAALFPTIPRDARRASAPTGWRDDLDDLRPWVPVGDFTHLTVTAPERGLARLTQPRVPPGFPYAYQWNGIYRFVAVDLDKTPIVVARLSALGKGSYADISVQKAGTGRTTTDKSTTAHGTQQPGLVAANVAKECGLTGRQRVRVQLNVGGTLDGISGEYTWVAFVSEAQWARLQADPNAKLAGLQ